MSSLFAMVLVVASVEPSITDVSQSTWREERHSLLVSAVQPINSVALVVSKRPSEILNLNDLPKKRCTCIVMRAAKEPARHPNQLGSDPSKHTNRQHGLMIASISPRHIQGGFVGATQCMKHDSELFKTASDTDDGGLTQTAQVRIRGEPSEPFGRVAVRLHTGRVTGPIERAARTNPRPGRPSRLRPLRMCSAYEGAAPPSSARSFKLSQASPRLRRCRGSLVGRPDPWVRVVAALATHLPCAPL